MNLFKSVFLSLCLMVLTSTLVMAQSGANLLAGKDLSTIKVDALTDTELAQIQAQLKQSGVSIDMVESQAIAKGMSPTEFAKLKARLANVKGGKSTSPLTKKTVKKAAENPQDTTEQDFFIESKINPLIYGSELFANSQGFKNSENVATPLNYEVGTNDVLKLVVYGVQEYSADLDVSKEGTVLIENVGRVKVAGLTIEAATTRIKQQMANTAYPSLRSGESKMALTVGDTRTIQVTIIGAQRSGNYNVSSLSNVLSALTMAGGPSEIGSYRAIELIRQNKVVKTFDLYAFMQNGDQSQNMGLKDRDVIKVPPYKGRIEIKGQVKRPGIFELNATESFKQFLQYAGGFDDTAYTAWVKVIQKNDKEKTVKDLAQNQFTSYQPQGGDIIQVSKILDRFQNRVKLTGAVFRPDVYELTEGMRISDLVQRADGLREDAFIGRAQLVRLKPNLLKELVTVNLFKALQKDPNENILLQREDELYINSIVDLRDSLTVDLLGEVRSQGRFNYVDSMTVKDLILMAGGFTFAANKQIEVARLVQYGDKVTDNQVATILRTEVNGDLSFNAGQENFVLQPMDVVTITKKVGYTNPEVVSISGQVQNVGKYTLSTRVERVSDIVKRAGGLIGEAYGEGAYIKRSRYQIDTLKSDESKTSIEEAYNKKFKAQQAAEKQNLTAILNPSNANGMDNQTSVLEAQNQKKKNLKDTLDILFKELNEDTYQIAIDINKIIQKPGAELDLVLRDKDEIIIPKMDNRVKISGGVLRPTNIVYRDGLTIGECISAAGGISEYAKRGRAYVVYANGKSSRTRHFGLFRLNPTIKPGAEIVLPETNEKKEKPLTTVIQFTTILAQIVSAIATVSILNK
ncbi:MAG: SLBB domain-containing protein [Chitinophagaceae bacterium]|nr:SLBB domain-containing protein [Chitinophagaceae bacterium]